MLAFNGSLSVSTSAKSEKSYFFKANGYFSRCFCFFPTLNNVCNDNELPNFILYENFF